MTTTPPCAVCGTKSRRKDNRRRKCAYCPTMVCDLCYYPVHRTVINEVTGVTVCKVSPDYVITFNGQELEWIRAALDAYYDNLGGRYVKELNRMGALLKRLSAACISERRTS